MTKTFADVKYLADKLGIDYMSAASILEKVDSMEEALEYATKSKSKEFRKNEIVKIKIKDHYRYFKILSISKPTIATLELLDPNYWGDIHLANDAIILEEEHTNQFGYRVDSYVFLNKQVYIHNHYGAKLEKTTKEEKKRFKKTKEKQIKEWIKQEFHH
jgi:hypothetical protein